LPTVAAGIASGAVDGAMRASVGAKVDQTDQEIEHIARAFFVARHETGVWETASRVLKHEFRLYARHALRMLEKKQEQVWSEGRSVATAEVLKAA
jgi:protein-disulfide isomerase-like protein with CxxC motif